MVAGVDPIVVDVAVGEAGCGGTEEGHSVSSAVSDDAAGKGGGGIADPDTGRCAEVVLSPVSNLAVGQRRAVVYRRVLERDPRPIPRLSRRDSAPVCIAAHGIVPVGREDHVARGQRAGAGTAAGPDLNIATQTELNDGIGVYCQGGCAWAVDRDNTCDQVFGVLPGGVARDGHCPNVRKRFRRPW